MCSACARIQIYRIKFLTVDGWTNPWIERRLLCLLVFRKIALQEEWLGSSTTTLHARAARIFASSSGCERMVTELTHIDRGVLDTVLTDVPDLVGVWVDSPVGTSDHSAVYIDVLEQQEYSTTTLHDTSALDFASSSGWLRRTGDKPWFDDQRVLAHPKQRVFRV